MNRIIVISLSIIILIGIGCASKRYARKGEKFEKAGLYEMATDAYLQSLAKRKDNIDAIVGLKRAGQHVVDENCTTVVKSYQVDDQKKQYTYILKLTPLGTGLPNMVWN